MGLAPLELDQDTNLKDRARRHVRVPVRQSDGCRPRQYPDITVLPSRITRSATGTKASSGRSSSTTSLIQAKLRRPGAQRFRQGGRDRVAVGVGAAINKAIPASRLAEFLSAPGLVFDPPHFMEIDRMNPIDSTVRYELANARDDAAR